MPALVPFEDGRWRHRQASSARADALARLDAALIDDDTRIVVLRLDRRGFRGRSTQAFDDHQVVQFRFTVDGYLSLSVPARAVRTVRAGWIEQTFITDFDFVVDDPALEDVEELASLLVDAVLGAQAGD